MTQSRPKTKGGDKKKTVIKLADALADVKRQKKLGAKTFDWGGKRLPINYVINQMEAVLAQVPNAQVEIYPTREAFMLTGGDRP